MSGHQDKLTLKAVIRSTVVGAKLARSIRTRSSLARRRMNEVDEKGWAHIHHAASKGYFKSVEKFIKANHDQLEFETQDELKETPLLIAVRAGMLNIETIEVIIELGGNLAAINGMNHGIVEISCLESHNDMLEYFIRLDRPELPVWRKLLRFCESESEEEAEPAGRALYQLTEPSDIVVNSNWRHVYDNGGVQVLVKILKGSIADSAKVQMLKCLINILNQAEVKKQVVDVSGLDILISNIKKSENQLLRFSCQAMAVICSVPTYADLCAQKGAIPALTNVTKRFDVDEILIEALKVLGVLCEDSEKRQSMVASCAGSLQTITLILENHVMPQLLLVTCQCVAKICRRHPENQKSFIECGGASHITLLSDIKNKDIQLTAIDAVHTLVEKNPYAQEVFVSVGVVTPLVNLLNRSKSPEVQEKTADALWALAGDSYENKRAMALTVGVDLLIDFLNSLSEKLHYIGSEALGVLARGPHNEQDAIAEGGGIQSLIRLLKSDKEYLVLSAIRSLRHLCVGIGYLPHKSNQVIVSKARGIKILLALFLLSRNELIQVESALTMASAALGNEQIMGEVRASGAHLEFRYPTLLGLLYSDDENVRSLAGEALATFAYNNMVQQQHIADDGGIRSTCFTEFLQSDDDFFRCNAAFQMVVLARIILDEEQAVTSATGIKIVVDVLRTSSDSVIQSLAADCVARLAHTRAGVPQAFVAIDTVESLSELMYSHNGQVRGCAAIALSYLSFDHKAERQLLNRCRSDPYLKQCLNHYTKKHKMSERFKNEWKHYRRVGSLPSISEGRPSLVTRNGYQEVLTNTNATISKPNTRLELPLITPYQEIACTPSYSHQKTSMSGIQESEDASDTQSMSYVSAVSRLNSIVAE